MQITDKELKAAYDKAADIRMNHLISDDVKLPNWGTAKGYWLAVLIHCSPDYVHKDDMSEIVRKRIPTAAADQQVRHLSDDGWNLEGDTKGAHCITDPYRAHPKYARQLKRSQNLLQSDDFTTIKKAFGNKCATCGAIENQPDPRYVGDMVKLQKGHKDPEKPMEKGNVIPQCQFCNRAYKDDFTFDNKGRVRRNPLRAPTRESRSMIALKEEREKRRKNKTNN